MKPNPLLSSQRPLKSGVVEQREFVCFREVERPFQTTADVVGAGRHTEVEGDGIEAIDEGFGKTEDDGAFGWFHGDI